MNDYIDLRRELPGLAKALGLTLEGGQSITEYRICRGGWPIAYPDSPVEAKAFLRGYQHGLETARVAGEAGVGA